VCSANSQQDGSNDKAARKMERTLVRALHRHEKLVALATDIDGVCFAKQYLIPSCLRILALAGDILHSSEQGLFL
jgi:hypothetical protein